MTALGFRPGCGEFCACAALPRAVLVLELYELIVF